MLLQVTCKSGLKEFRFFTVNSPVHAVVKKVVVRQVKTAASRGSVSDRWEQILIMVSIVYGLCGGRFKEAGARVFVALMSALISSNQQVKGERHGRGGDPSQGQHIFQLF